jgi:hypothetical protein
MRSIDAQFLFGTVSEHRTEVDTLCWSGRSVPLQVCQVGIITSTSLAEPGSRLCALALRGGVQLRPHVG